MKRMIREDNRIITRYDSVSDLLETPTALYGDALKRWERSVDPLTKRTGITPLEWYGVKNCAAGVEDALRRGWPEGTDKMREALDVIQVPRVKSIRRKGVWDSHGDELDIHKVNSGNVGAAWRRRKREMGHSRNGPHVTIAVDVSCSWSTTANNAMWRGATAVALAQAAIESGRNVRILLCWAARKPFGNIDRMDIAVEVKSYHSNVSTDVLMTMLSLPGFYRVYGFAAYADAPYDDRGNINESYGKCVYFDKTLLQDQSALLWVDQDVLSSTQAQKKITKLASQLN